MTITPRENENEEVPKGCVISAIAVIVVVIVVGWLLFSPVSPMTIITPVDEAPSEAASQPANP